MKTKTSDTARSESVTSADPDMPREADFSRGVRGMHWPRDPVEALPKALARLRVMQQTAAQLRDENEHLRSVLENVLRLLGTSARSHGDRHEVLEAVREIRRALDDTGEDVPAVSASG